LHDPRRRIDHEMDLDLIYLDQERRGEKHRGIIRRRERIADKKSERQRENRGRLE
jgi:hypothetical protein